MLVVFDSRSEDESEESEDNVVFRDVIAIMLLVLLCFIVIILPYINEKEDSEEKSSEPPGNIVVEILWPDKLDTDVDLWVQGPGDIPVGYSNKGGGLFNLLRDDLGHAVDVSGINYEVAYSRGIVPGEYTVNIHLYRKNHSIPPIPVHVVISVKSPVNKSTRQILYTDVKLKREGQELTVFRFGLTASGELVPDSIHNLYKPLRSAGKS